MAVGPPNSFDFVNCSKACNSICPLDKTASYATLSLNYPLSVSLHLSFPLFLSCPPPPPPPPLFYASSSAFSPVIPEQDISTCIKTRCKDFLKYTNWKLLLPHLHANELLDSDITDVLMSNYQTNRDKGLVFYLSVLPSKGHTAYSRFYQCLLEEEEHSGHRTLLELLDDFNKT